MGDRRAPFCALVGRLSTMPGLSSVSASAILSEIGSDMSRFSTPAQLVSWAGLCPRNDESAGRRRSARLRRGAPWLKTHLNTVSALAEFVLAHGAGTGMTHPYLEAVADGLAERGLASLGYQFPFMEQGSRRPDPPKLAHATVRAAVAEAGRLAPDLPLVAGGKSFGGRRTSQAQAASHLPGVRGLAFLGFPLHPSGKPSSERAQHLFEIDM